MNFKLISLLSLSILSLASTLSPAHAMFAGEQDDFDSAPASRARVEEVTTRVSARKVAQKFETLQSTDLNAGLMVRTLIQSMENDRYIARIQDPAYPTVDALYALRKGQKDKTIPFEQARQTALQFFKKINSTTLAKSFVEKLQELNGQLKADKQIDTSFALVEVEEAAPVSAAASSAPVRPPIVTEPTDDTALVVASSGPSSSARAEAYEEFGPAWSGPAFDEATRILRGGSIPAILKLVTGMHPATHMPAEWTGGVGSVYHEKIKGPLSSSSGLQAMLSSSMSQLGLSSQALSVPNLNQQIEYDFYALLPVDGKVPVGQDIYPNAFSLNGVSNFWYCTFSSFTGDFLPFMTFTIVNPNHVSGFSASSSINRETHNGHVVRDESSASLQLTGGKSFGTVLTPLNMRPTHPFSPAPAPAATLAITPSATAR